MNDYGGSDACGGFGGGMEGCGKEIAVERLMNMRRWKRVRIMVM